MASFTHFCFYSLGKVTPGLTQRISLVRVSADNTRTAQHRKTWHCIQTVCWRTGPPKLHRPNVHLFKLPWRLCAKHFICIIYLIDFSQQLDEITVLPQFLFFKRLNLIVDVKCPHSHNYLGVVSCLDAQVSLPLKQCYYSITLPFQIYTYIISLWRHGQSFKPVFRGRKCF